MALRERRRPFAVRAVLVGTVHGERPPAHHVIQRGAGLPECPADRVDGQVELAGPVTRRSRLAGGGERCAAAHVALVAPPHTPPVPPPLLPPLPAPHP